MLIPMERHSQTSDVMFYPLHFANFQLEEGNQDQHNDMFAIQSNQY